MGFISDLPPDLVAAFRATLEEVTEADLILHVRDIAHPDSAAQASDVRGVLRDLGLGAKVDAGLIEVLNKIDLLQPEARRRLLAGQARNGLQVALSAVTGERVEALLAAIDRRLGEGRNVSDLSVSLADGAGLAWLYDHGRVLSRQDDERFAHLKVQLDPADLARFSQRRDTG